METLVILDALIVFGWQYFPKRNFIFLFCLIQCFGFFFNSWPIFVSIIHPYSYVTLSSRYIRYEIPITFHMYKTFKAEFKLV